MSIPDQKTYVGITQTNVLAPENVPKQPIKLLNNPIRTAGKIKHTAPANQIVCPFTCSLGKPCVKGKAK